MALKPTGSFVVKYDDAIGAATLRSAPKTLYKVVQRARPR